MLVAAIITNAFTLYALFLVSLLIFAGQGMSGGVFSSKVESDRTAEAVRGNFPARKRFEDRPAEYDEAAWAAYKARLAERGRE